jgi:hypothetical protein
MLEIMKRATRPARHRILRLIVERRARNERLRFVDWLASPEGPAPSPALKTFKVRPETWMALWGRRLLSGEFNLPMPRGRLYVPPPPLVKVAALRRYARSYRLATFIETGTHLGRTVASLSPEFDRCFTIELSANLHQRAVERFSSIANVTCLQGDSTDVLPCILQSLNTAALFWLDAHASGGETVNSGKGPIVAELEAIFSHRVRTHVVLIDDARGHDLSAIWRVIPPHMKATNRNDIIRITPAR